MQSSGSVAGVQRMKRLTLELTVEELTLLATLASDQLFRREFIDPKMPGYKADPGEVQTGKSLVARMRAIVGQVPLYSRSSPGDAPRRAFANPSKRPNGNPDAF